MSAGVFKTSVTPYVSSQNDVGCCHGLEVGRGKCMLTVGAKGPYAITYCS